MERSNTSAKTFQNLSKYLICLNQIFLCTGISRSGPGRAILQSWEYDDQEIEEIMENLSSLSHSYSGEDSEDSE